MIARWSDWVYDMGRWALNMMFDPRTKAERRAAEWEAFCARQERTMQRLEAERHTRTRREEDRQRQSAQRQEYLDWMEEDRREGEKRYADYLEHVTYCSAADHELIRAFGSARIAYYFCVWPNGVYSRPAQPERRAPLAPARNP